MTTYDHEPWVTEALDSLASQTFDDFEVVIVDDNSRDRTVEVIRGWIEHHDLPARLITNERNMGVAAVMNLAMNATRGEHVCGVSGDHRTTPGWIERQHRCLAETGGGVAGVFSDMRLIGPTGEPLGQTWLRAHGLLPPPVGQALFRELLKQSFLPTPAVMVNREALDAVGPHDETLVFEDYDMWLRIAARYDFEFVPGTPVDYRVHPSSFSQRSDRACEFLIDVGRVQARWRGRHPDIDRLNACRLWRQGRELESREPAAARQLLELAEELVPVPVEGLALKRHLPRRHGARPGRDRAVPAGARDCPDARSCAGDRAVH
jgi:glycosyltransferase involved in cell wall biosynthesis